MKYENEYMKLRKIYKHLHGFEVFLFVMVMGGLTGFLLSVAHVNSLTALFSVFVSLKSERDEEMREALRIGREEYYRKEIVVCKKQIAWLLLKYLVIYLLSAISSATMFLISIAL